MTALLALLARLAALAIPLDTPDGWEVLRYSGIRPNTARFDADGLHIAVDASACPIVRPLPAPVRVRALRLTGLVVGPLETTARLQGSRGHDDYALRVGLVEVGTRRPTWLERLFAPAWVKRLFALAPPDLGIAGIRFHNLGLDASQIGATRVHPASELVTERIVGVPGADGRFDVTVTLTSPIETAAVWLSADGDDTRSRFEVTLSSLVLMTVEDAAAATAPPARR